MTKDYTPDLQKLFLENQEVFEFLTRKKLSLKSLTNSVSLPFKNFDYEIETDQIDKDKILKKLSENSETLNKEKTGIDKNLNNSNFVDRAPKDLIQQNKNRQNAISLELSKIDSILSNLNG